jgi:hypothetical protein
MRYATEPNDDVYTYDPDHPQNIADRANDPDDGIDYDEIIAMTEPDFRAGRGLQFASLEAFNQWLGDIFDRAIARHTTDVTRRAS